MSYAPRIDNIDKNYLMNGGMDLFQRAFGSAISLGTSFAYQTADRWSLQYAGTFSGAPTSISSSSVPNNDSKYSILFNANASVISSEIDMRQRLESIISAELSSQMVSIGFWINSESPSHAVLEIYQPQGLDNWTTSSLIYTQTKAFTVGGWQLVTFDGITLPATQNGLEIRIRLNNWTVLAALKNVWISQIGFTKTATFDGFNRHGGTLMSEIRACQRYYEKSYDIETNPATVTNNGAGQWFAIPNLTNSLYDFEFESRKRAVPAVVFYSPVNGATGVAYNNASGNISASAGVTGERSVSIATTGGAGGALSNYVAHFTADAEL